MHSCQKLIWPIACVPQSLVAEMAMRYRECFGEVFRFQIINSTLWVDHISERHGGWYPSQDGEGDTRTLLKHSVCEGLDILQVIMVLIVLCLQETWQQKARYPMLS